jgi:hypothetical protein
MKMRTNQVIVQGECRIVGFFDRGGFRRSTGGTQGDFTFSPLPCRVNLLNRFVDIAKVTLGLQKFKKKAQSLGVHAGCDGAAGGHRFQ